MTVLADIQVTHCPVCDQRVAKNGGDPGNSSCAAKLLREGMSRPLRENKRWPLRQSNCVVSRKKSTNSLQPYSRTEMSASRSSSD